MSTAQEVKGTTTIYRFAFAFGTVALLLPIIIMVGTATRLSAARREERYAAMRLVGATPRQIRPRSPRSSRSSARPWARCSGCSAIWR